MLSFKSKKNIGLYDISKSVWEKVFDSTDDRAIWILDTDGNVLKSNKISEKLIGYKDREISGKNFNILFSSKDFKDKNINKSIEQSIKLGTTRFECKCIRKDGSVFWADFVLSTIKGLDSTKALLVLVFQDTSIYKKREQQKDEYIGVASHELRTPISALSLYSELLSDMLYAKVDDEAIKIFEDMRGQIKRVVNLVDDLLVVNEIERNSLTLNKKPFDIDSRFLKGGIGLSIWHSVPNISMLELRGVSVLAI